MNIFKRFKSNSPMKTKTAEEVLTFKNKLKYGEDILGMYKESRKLIHQGIDQENYVKEKLEEIFKYEKRKIYDNWTSFRISTFDECKKSPIKQCLYISYYGNLNPEKNDPIYCMCCEKKLF